MTIEREKRDCRFEWHGRPAHGFGDLGARTDLRAKNHGRDARATQTGNRVFQAQPGNRLSPLQTPARAPATAPRYAGRLAPSPTGFLHLGHARTFWMAAERARTAPGAGGELFLRNDDLDRPRCRAEYVAAMIEDLRWLGLRWREPVISQSERIPLYRAALARLHAAGLVYPCNRSRRDVAEAAGAPHEGAGAYAGAGADAAHDEPVFPPEWRPAAGAPVPALPRAGEPIATNWRLRVPDGETIFFTDNALGPQHAVAGRDFGDFLVWRRDDLPGYQLACAVDDAALGVTEVVRGADLVQSTFRQILIFRALGLTPPHYYHCPLMTDASGRRLAKRHDALALRTLRARGVTPAEILRQFANTAP